MSTTMTEGSAQPRGTISSGPGPDTSTPHRPYGIFSPMRVAFWCTLLFVIAFLPIAWMMDQVLQANATDRTRLEIAIRLGRYADSISAAMNRRLTLLSAMSTFVQTHESPTQFDRNLQIFTSGLFSTVDGLASVRIIDGEDILVVFPTPKDYSLSGPEAEFRQPGSARARALLRAIQSRRITVVDPDPGTTTDQMLTSYQTVYDESGSPRGTLSIAFELEPILREAGLDTEPADLRLVLRTSSGRAFFGHPTVYTQDPVIADLDGTGFSWELAAVPRRGWAYPVSGEYRMLRAAGISITSLLAVLVYLIVGFQERLKVDVRHRTLALREANRALEKGMTERQAALDELQETSFGLAHAMPSIARLNPQGTIQQANPSFAGLFGSTPDGCMGSPWLSVFSPADEARLQGAYEEMKTAGTSEFEVQAQGSEETPLYCEGLLMRREDVQGRFRGGLLYLRDITERKEQEKTERTLYENLARARRMESIGKLAGGVAHDLNNILGPIVAYPDLILAALPEDHPACADVISIRDASMNAKLVIQDLLTLARRGRNQHQSVDLNQVVDEYCRSANFRELEGSHPKISVHTVLSPAPLPVVGSRSQLQQVTLNLITNAFEAIAAPGNVQISTYCEAVDEERASSHDALPGEHVVLQVTDDGEGIPPADADQIFEPFFSTKEMGRSGTGLGLTVAYGVVRDHKGFIEVTSAPGEGATFRIFLPLTEPLEPAESTESVVVPTGTEAVLVVDDRETQRELAGRLLRQLGYAVDSAPHGHAALDYLQSHSVDLVILDMIMEQGFDGLDTYKAIRLLNPEQRCLIASGYAANDRIKQALELGVRAYLPKPYTLENIGLLAREVLDQPVAEDQS